MSWVENADLRLGLAVLLLGVGLVGCVFGVREEFLMLIYFGVGILFPTRDVLDIVSREKKEGF